MLAGKVSKLADNVSEFAYKDTIATLLGERKGKSKPSTATQTGPAERRGTQERPQGFN